MKTKRINKTKIKAAGLLLLILAGTVLLPSCAGDYGRATPGWYRPAVPSDPGARFGLLLETVTPPAVPEPLPSAK